MDMRAKHAGSSGMNFRLAVMQDLPRIKKMYRGIIQQMNENQIPIWDDIYPCDFFENDIMNNQLYLMLDNTEILAAFALCDSNSGENAVEWEDSSGKALYIDRLGVNADYSRKGIGSLMLTKAKETARTLGAEYLRLFVVDINTPAIQLYSQNGFTRVKGVYDEVIDTDYILHQYGYELQLC